MKREDFTSNFWDNYCPKIFPYFFLVSVVWLSHFLLVDSFGLYEDDWGFSGTAIAHDFDSNWLRVKSALLSFWQGRPLHMTFLTFIPFIGAKLGGLKVIYLIGFVFVSLNVCLWYKLIVRISKQKYLATLSSLFLALYPADTTFSFLQHLLGIQTALLLILIAFHFFITSTSSKYHLTNKILSYVFATLSLLDYESLFLVFFAAPLLVPQGTTKKEKIQHSLTLVGILGGYFLLRKLVGESRVTEAIEGSLLQKLLLQVTFGPLVAFSTFFRRAWEVIIPFKWLNLFLVLLSSLLLGFILFYLLRRQLSKVTDNSLVNNYRKLWFLAGVGLLMTILAYPSALLLAVEVVDGRASRVHFSAALGTTLIMGCGWLSLLLWSRGRTIARIFLIVFLSLQLGFLFTFSINVQQYYKLSWQYQQNFWQDVLTLAPDLNEGTVILLDLPDLPWGKQINPFDWSMPFVLESIYRFPDQWKYRPRLYLINPKLTGSSNWSQEMVKDNRLVLSSENQGLRLYFPWEPPREVPFDQVVLIEREGDRLIRKDKLSLPSGHEILLKSLTNQHQLPNYPKTVIFDSLIPVNGDCRDCPSSTPIYFQPQL